jgi:acetyltransferase-like isoleucine patch superfamily enzyme
MNSEIETNAPFIHEKAICESQEVGAGTRVWAFAHILPKAKLGNDCNICAHVFIENDVVVGHRVTVKCGVQLWDGLRVEDDVFIGPNATFTNDAFPRSKVRPTEFLQTILKKGSSVGANATILPGITIGQNAMVGAGSVVTHSVPANAIVIGNPAQIVGYVDSDPAVKAESTNSQPITSERVPSKVKGVYLQKLPFIEDIRSNLIVGEFENLIPFIPKRYFMVFDVPNREVRGESALKDCQQFFVCIKGSVSFVADDGKSREDFLLDSPTVGLYVPEMTWSTQYKYSKDAVLLVFASTHYNAQSYVRDYEAFLKMKKT